MISFYPGPSKVYEQVPNYVQEAYTQGIVSINHRGEEFVEISKRTIALLKTKLNLPEDYTIFYASSATECWEIIAQSLIKKKSIHYYNGAFGEKWFEYTNKLTDSAYPQSFSIEEALNPQATDADVLCVTQNETSNGTAVGNELIKEVKDLNPNALIAVDATSSMGGIVLDFSNADVWFASIQKCFGLPAGMALMVCSPRAIERALTLNRNVHYNSMVFMIDKMKVYQTTYTPNVLSIYLLMRVFETREVVEKIDKQTLERYSNWIKFFSSLTEYEHLIKNTETHSATVLPITAPEGIISSLKVKAKKAGFLIGSGYGVWASNTFRIANFPAITDNEIQQLQLFLRKSIT